VIAEKRVPTFVGNLGKIPLGRRRARKEGNIKIDIDEV
jgi:hypothetical protein